MQPIQRRLVALLMSLALGLNALPAFASPDDEDMVNPRPNAAGMFLDAVLARPMLLVLTTVGTATFIVSLPFSILGGNTGESAKNLVLGPAKSTFLRCLGCTEAQDRWKRAQAHEAEADATAAQTVSQQ